MRATEEMDSEALLDRKTLIIACGALARETLHLIEKNELSHLEVQCISAQLHHRPHLIPQAVGDKIRAARGRYHKIYVLYGDCGTGGELDRVLRQEGGVERIAGPHCFSFYMGNDTFSDHQKDDVTTFYLTDFFCRHFEKFMWEAYGLDRREDMVDFVFGNYTKLLYISQTNDPDLHQKAREIAGRLRLSFEYRYQGYGDIENALLNVK